MTFVPLLVLVAALGVTAVEPVLVFEDERLTESSGLVASPGQDVLWTVNDSGADAVVHGVDPSGCTRVDLVLDSVDVRDVEDLTIDQTGRLVVADVGDNQGVRADIAVHRVAEPVLDLAGPCPSVPGTVVAPATTERIVLEDGAEDVEAAVIDPVSGDLLLVTKGRTRAPEVLVVAGGVASRIAAPAFPVGSLVTGAASRPDGGVFVVRTYGQAFVFVRDVDLATTFAEVDAVVDLPLQPQGEAIAWPSTDQWLLSSEDPLGTRPPVLRVTLAEQPPPDDVRTAPGATTTAPTPEVTAPTPAPTVDERVDPAVGPSAGRPVGIVLVLGVLLACLTGAAVAVRRHQASRQGGSAS